MCLEVTDETERERNEQVDLVLTWRFNRTHVISPRVCLLARSRDIRPG